MLRRNWGWLRRQGLNIKKYDMRLAAIYIPQNSLPHIFGGDHSGQTLNLGGNYFYSFNETTEEITIDGKIKNELFISNFYHKDIPLISTIVGQNGSGKSTLLRAINHSIDPSSRKLVYIFESESISAIKIFNDSKKKLYCIEDIENQLLESKPFQPLYYSPSLDYDLKDALSPVALINHLHEDLENYFLDSVSRNVSFLNDEIIQSIEEIYYDFPNYDSIQVKVKKHRKSFFRAPYIESNFGTPHRGDALKNEIKGDLFRIADKERGLDSYTREQLINQLESYVMFLDSESFTEMFTKLWKVEEYDFSDDSGYDFLHNADNFIKNTEINILSFLLLGSVFPQTGLGGGFSFDKVIEAKSFKERLDLFLELYLVHEEKVLYQTIKDKVGIDVANFEPIIKIIKSDKFVRLSGVDVVPVKKRMIADVQGFGDIYNFYVKLNEFCKNNNIHFQEDGLIFNIKNAEAKILFDELILSYKYVLKSFPKSPTKISLFEFIPNKKLSTGEKAILDFYSSVYNYIDIYKENLHHNHENFLLLLDEPDLGFHPVWKKKFIKAVSSTLPILFSKMTPHKYDSEATEYIKVRENPLVQIIFTTHDPLTLSDMPNNSVVYVKKKGDYSTILLHDNVDRPQKTFGANIHELLAESFFLEDGMIGDFAKVKIQDLVRYLTYNVKLKENSINEKPIEAWDEISANKVIQLIGEPVIKERLQSLYDKKFLDREKNLIEARIDELQRKLAKLNEKNIN